MVLIGEREREKNDKREGTSLRVGEAHKGL